MPKNFTNNLVSFFFVVEAGYNVFFPSYVITFFLNDWLLVSDIKTVDTQIANYEILTFYSVILLVISLESASDYFVHGRKTLFTFGA
jgi:hypothetical protein